MKNIMLAVLSIVIMSGCGKNDNSVITEGHDNRIAIKGSIPQTLSKTTSDSLTLADAKKVLLFYGGRFIDNTNYSIADIAEGGFSASAPMGIETALVFLDSNYRYIGNLYVDGLNMLPLNNLPQGDNTVIDLSTLTLVGHHVVPSHDPFGNEILLTEAELASFREIDSYFESLSKNIDADNDGTPDLLTNSHIYVTTIFGMYVGHWGTDSTEASEFREEHSYNNYFMTVSAGTGITLSNSSTVALTGPQDDPYTDISMHGIRSQSTTFESFNATFRRETRAPEGAPWGSTFLPFKKGTYTLTVNGNETFIIDYSNMDMKRNLIIVTPTLHTNSEGKLTSVTLRYTLPDGSTINPQSMLTGVMVQLSSGVTELYHSDWLNGETGFGEATLSTPLDISTLTVVGTSYDDMIGNRYIMVWQ